MGVMEILQRTADALPRDLAFVGLGIALLVVARFVKDLLTPFEMSEEMTVKDNPALGLSVAGYYVGVLLVVMGPLMTPASQQQPLWQDLAASGGYALLGILLLNIARYIVDKVLLRGFSTVEEIVRDRNVGTGAVEMGAYVASGAIIGGALYGQGGGPHTAVAFFLLGQLCLVGYGTLYRLTCGYDLHGEIERDNVAAGVALGLNLVAMGVVVMKGVSGEFLSWESSLVRLGVTVVLGGGFRSPDGVGQPPQ